MPSAMMIQQNQETAQRPFPSLRAGSGYETSYFHTKFTYFNKNSALHPARARCTCYAKYPTRLLGCDKYRLLAAIAVAAARVAGECEFPDIGI